MYKYHTYSYVNAYGILISKKEKRVNKTLKNKKFNAYTHAF